jgi:hypothetical protein
MILAGFSAVGAMLMRRKRKTSSESA